MLFALSLVFLLLFILYLEYRVLPTLDSLTAAVEQLETTTAAAEVRINDALQAAQANAITQQDVQGLTDRVSAVTASIGGLAPTQAPAS
jgi:uncharacterized protein YoxC